MIKSTTHPITWSDHVPVTLNIQLDQTRSRKCHWQLNDLLLKFPESRDKIAQAISQYFVENNAPISDLSE